MHQLHTYWNWLNRVQICATPEAITKSDGFLFRAGVADMPSVWPVSVWRSDADHHWAQLQRQPCADMQVRLAHNFCMSITNQLQCLRTISTAVCLGSDALTVIGICRYTACFGSDAGPLRCRSAARVDAGTASTRTVLVSTRSCN
jgi:hypothetical protein